MKGTQPRPPCTPTLSTAISNSRPHWPCQSRHQWIMCGSHEKNTATGCVWDMNTTEIHHAHWIHPFNPSNVIPYFLTQFSECGLKLSILKAEGNAVCHDVWQQWTAVRWVSSHTVAGMVAWGQWWGHSPICLKPQWLAREPATKDQRSDALWIIHRHQRASRKGTPATPLRSTGLSDAPFETDKQRQDDVMPTTNIGGISVLAPKKVYISILVRK